jgi:chaperonin GroEL
MIETKNNIRTGEECQEKIINGISQVSEIIRQSYGPKGGNVLVESQDWPGHMVCNDAQSIIQAIHIEDPVERRGLNLIKELSDKASKDSGEGRKTTVIMAEELLKGGFDAKIKGMKLKEELDVMLPEVLKSIDSQAQKVELSDIGKVAETSARDRDTGAWIQKIYNEIGRDGVIHVEGSGTFETRYEVTDGVRFEGAGLLSPYMVFGDANKAIYENPIILVTKKKIEKDKDIEGLVNKAVKEARPLVIFTDDFDQNVATRVIATHRAGVAKILIIRAPILYKQAIFEDFARCVGATIVDTGIVWDKLPLDFLGTCGKLICDKEDTVLMGIQDIEPHKEQLRKEGSDDSLLRVYRLNTKTAILKMGAGSESELSYKRLKAMDACNAARLALDPLGGVVEGAGKSLVKASDVLPESIAGDIFRKALNAPYEQLLVNEGGELDTEGVYDSALVVKNAVKNAVSLAGIVLTTQGDIRLPELSAEDKQLQILSLQQRKVNF